MSIGTVMDGIASMSRIFAWALAPLMLFMTTATQAAPSHLWEGAKNRDGSEVKLRIRLDHAAQKKSVDVLYRQASHGPFRSIGRFDLPWDSPPQGRAFLLDWDGDGQHEVQILSDCGAGPNCDGVLYRIDKSSGKLVTFFNTGGSDVQLIDGHLVESARDSCCSWVANAYKFDAKRYLVTPEPAFTITVEYRGESRATTPVMCTFSVKSSQGRQIIAPPAKRFLRLCRHYGDKYVVAKK